MGVFSSLKSERDSTEESKQTSELHSYCTSETFVALCILKTHIRRGDKFRAGKTNTFQQCIADSLSQNITDVYCFTGLRNGRDDSTNNNIHSAKRGITK